MGQMLIWAKLLYAVVAPVRHVDIAAAVAQDTAGDGQVQRRQVIGEGAPETLMAEGHMSAAFPHHQAQAVRQHAAGGHGRQAGVPDKHSSLQQQTHEQGQFADIRDCAAAVQIIGRVPLLRIIQIHLVSTLQQSNKPKYIQIPSPKYLQD